jgi:anaerobic selenocysteine-containing dehydrogenase
MPLDTLPSRAIRSSVCPHDCPSACALDIEVLDGTRIGAVHGADNSYTSGVVCAKVGRYAERANHPARLTHPLLRTGPKGSGQFTPIGWNEALDRIAAAFQQTERQHGKLSVWPYHSAGTMGLINRDGIERLRNVMGYSRQKMTICTAIAAAGWQAGVGNIWGPDTREVAKSDLVVIWGGNPVSTQVNLMSHISRARKERGAQMVVIDPYRTPSAAAADMHLALRPGTDAALACAVMHVAFRDGYADRAYMARYADCPEALEQHLATRDPAWAAGITGLSVDEIETFARLYGKTARAFIRVGYGFTRTRNGAANMHAVTCVPTVCGKWQHEGSGATWSQRGIYGWNKTLIEGLEHRDHSIRELDMSRIASVLTGDPEALCGGPPVHAILIQSSNPASIAPDSHRVREGLLREDLFVAVHDQFMTDTAQLADIVLPATMFFEHDDIYQAGGHSHIQLGPKLIEPPSEARSNHDVVCALAARLGAEHPGFAMTALEMADATLRASGWPDVETLRSERWIDAQPDFALSHHLTGFGFPDGKFRFAPDWAALGPHIAGLPTLPDHAPMVDDTLPFRLVAPPPRQFLNSTFTETPGSRKREVRPTVRLCPADAERLGISEGSRVRLGNKRGAVELHAAITAGQQPGVMITEGVWPNADWNGGIGINALTSDEPAGPAGGAVFHDTSVWVELA